MGTILVFMILFMYKNSIYIKKINFHVFLLIFAALSSLIIGILVKDITNFIGSVEAISKFLRPVLIFTILYNLKEISITSEQSLRILMLVFVPFLFMAWVQILFLGKIGDDVHGMLKDSHEFANYGILCSIFILPYLKNKFNKDKFFIVAALIIIPILFASYLRAAFFIIITYALFIFIKRINSKNLFRIISSPLIFILPITLLFIFLRIFEELILGANTPLTRIVFTFFLYDNFNYIPIYLNSPLILLSDLKLFLFGFGPGEFGSTVSLYSAAYSGDNYVNKSMYDKLIYYYNFNIIGDGGASVIMSTTLSVMFLEYGTIFAIILFSIIKYIYMIAKDIFKYLPSHFALSIKFFAIYSFLFCVFERIYWESFISVSPFITILFLIIKDGSYEKHRRQMLIVNN